MTRKRQQMRFWLRGQLSALVNVQRVTFPQASLAADPIREADLIVQTWSGVVIHLHLIDEPLKMPRVKRLLDQSTGSGVVNLFMLDAELLPRPGEKVHEDRWYVPFAFLTNDWLYSYHLEGEQPVIRTLSFVPYARHELEARAAGPIAIQNLRHYRSTSRHHHLKGYWLLADFETERSAQSPHHRPPQGEWFPPPGQQKSTPPTSPLSGFAAALDDSYRLLGVTRAASYEEVKAAFRRLVFQVHPDVSALPRPVAEERFRALNEAYERIKDLNSWS
ncbi:MAG TPA: J domain-containing protein [Aggregatilineales bacterium]|nr:J domain-containing protein [Aggregatilineales bacterium]